MQCLEALLSRAFKHCEPITSKVQFSFLSNPPLGGQVQKRRWCQTPVTNEQRVAKISHFLIKCRSKFHIFYDASFWASFFEILVRLGAKKLDFVSPLAPSWAQNGTQNRPNGAKNGSRTFPGQLHCADLLPRSLSERSWAPFLRIFEGF